MIVHRSVRKVGMKCQFSIKSDSMSRFSLEDAVSFPSSINGLPWGVFDLRGTDLKSMFSSTEKTMKITLLP